MTAADYRTVASILRKSIEDGTYRMGQRLPGQAALARDLGVGRHLIRRAQNHLIERGVLQSWQGSGVIVAASRYNYRISRMTRFGESLRNDGHTTATEYLGARLIRAPYAVAQLLQRPANSRLLQVELLRRVDGIPATVGRHYYDPARLSGIERLIAENASVTLAMRAMGIEITRVSTSAASRLASYKEATLLEIPPLQPVIEITGCNIDTAMVPVEVSIAVARSDRICLRI
ncbi:MAG: GntR family transcriptional regulator [Gemmobacter sp.]|nr:GntR family transcriptional regulator [Gemmobacter sp.]